MVCRKNGEIKMDYVLIMTLIFVMALNFFGNIWVTKKNNKEDRLKTVAIYSLYQELKRYNDNQFGKEKGGGTNP